MKTTQSSKVLDPILRPLADADAARDAVFLG